MWMGKNFFDPFKFRDRYNDGEATLATAISAYRNAKGVFNYLNVPRVHRNMMTILNNLRSDFRLYQNRWNSLNPNDTIDLVGYWDVWIRDFFRHFQQNALNSAERGYAQLLEMAPDAGEAFADGLILIEEYIEEIKNAEISDYGLE
jgi:hypothetical protein